MTIELVTFTPPVIVSSPKSIRSLISQAISEKKGKIVTLPSGIHDITPSQFEIPSLIHRLHVSPDGSGFYEAIPRDTEVGTIILGEENNLRFGPRTQNLRNCPAVIMGPVKNEGEKPKLAIFTMACWHAGPSPVDNRS